MNNEEWLSSSDPAAMLHYLRYSTHEEMDVIVTQSRHPGPSDRKLRLFAWNVHDYCCRFRGSVTTYREDELTITHWHNHGLSTEFQIECPTAKPMQAKAWLEGLLRNETSVSLLREVFGNPFSPMTCGWKTIRAARDMSSAALESGAAEEEIWYGDWKPTRTVLSVAQRIYAERDWAAMPILADALEESGCTDSAILRHCRGEERCPAHPTSDLSKYKGEWVTSPDGKMKGPKGPIPCDRCGDVGWIPLRGPHVRGCWVIDLILGQE